MKKEKRDKKKEFIRLANKRVNKTINYIRLVGNLANKTNYTYEDKQASKIVSALELEIRMVKDKFKRINKNGGDDTFEIS